MSKKYFSTVFGIGFLIVLGGCATPTVPMGQVDKEPALVGQPVEDILFASSSQIEGQKQLLNRLRTNKPLFGVVPVKHNNDLDARVGSPNTVSPFTSSKVANDPRVAEKEAGWNQAKANVIINPKLSNMVKKIDWKHNSLNDLAKSLADSLGYQFVLSSNGKPDLILDFYAENMQIGEVIAKLKNETNKSVEILIVDKNNTLNVIYRK
jgi:hypothetical protein